ncbi:phage tail protein [Vibrio vulnificus]|uniref:phage tail protein n=1 Tax=Vibrio vulnificus TaxID=672 RepID=UPI0024E005EF|nr:phage tail protein [Vibrio vulnificus]EIE1227647.1 phage tail protein [Vibrio vulnificus]MDK2679281.1 phage tail protein [Vibrio vulnificus]MDK2688043.1 phage tail protein [Vibrio vulnificus]
MSLIHKTMPMAEQVQQAIRRLELVKVSAVPAATARAINAIGAVSERRTAKEVAKSEKIQLRSVRSRITPIKKANVNETVRRVRVRRHDMPAVMVGKARQTRRGVSVRQHRFSGAFLADGSKGKGKYIASSRRRAGRQTHHDTQLRTQQVLQRTGKGRYPLEVVKVPISQPLTSAYERNVRRAYNQDLGPEMRKQLTRELVRVNKVR